MLLMEREFSVEDQDSEELIHSMKRTEQQTYAIEVFHDGDCPLCQREIALLRRWDKKQLIRFTDISTQDFVATEYGLTQADFMAEIRGRLPDGTWLVGVEVFRQLYSAVGLSWLVAPTRWLGIRQLLDCCYRVFAKNRLKLTGRCQAETCAIKK